MSSDKRPEKVPCHKCGKLCFRLCHNIGYKPGDRLVCLDCFKAACGLLSR